MDYIFCTRGCEKGYADFVSGFNWARHFCGEWFEKTGLLCMRGKERGDGVSAGEEALIYCDRSRNWKFEDQKCRVRPKERTKK
jgi:hypothetical protein